MNKSEICCLAHVLNTKLKQAKKSEEATKITLNIIEAIADNMVHVARNFDKELFMNLATSNDG